MLALDYTYRDIETETQYKHTNCPPILSELELRAVKPHTDIQIQTYYTGDRSSIIVTFAAVTNVADDPWPVF